MSIPIGLQLYSVREACAADLPGTLSKVAEFGYAGVDFAGYYDHDPADIRKMLDERGLACCGTHTRWDRLTDEALPETIEIHKTLGSPYCIVPSIPEELRRSRADWLEAARRFNDLADKLAEAGIRAGYHNHHFEFEPVDGEKPWDTLFANTKESVIMQLDTGNCMTGGGDPLEYLRKYPGRATTVHLKEFSMSGEPVVIGEGDVPWGDVFGLCETVGGTEWYIVEQESYKHDPLECVRLCLENLRGMGR